MEFNGQKRVYRYHNGADAIYADPMALDRRLILELRDVNAVIRQTKEEDPLVWVPAVESFLAAIRKVFELTPFDRVSGNGCDDQRVYDVYNEYQAWKEDQKKTSGIKPDISQPTATLMGTPRRTI
jgi:hypothetical protein